MTSARTGTSTSPGDRAERHYRRAAREAPAGSRYCYAFAVLIFGLVAGLGTAVFAVLIMVPMAFPTPVIVLGSLLGMAVGLAYEVVY